MLTGFFHCGVVLLIRLVNISVPVQTERLMKHHTTVKEACEHAEELRVKNLILYHTEDKNLADRRKLYTEEGQQYYHGNLIVPDDLDRILL